MPEFELVIRMNKDGSVHVTGPIQNKVLCYGAMEAAKEAIGSWHANQKAEPQLELATAPMVNGLPR